MMWWVWTVLGWLVCALWALILLPSAVSLLRRDLRRRAPKLQASLHEPFVSVVVPACNEEAAIERCLRSLLASEGIGVEVIAVDDRSTDATGMIMDRLAAEDARLHVIHVTNLPDGWLGKTHALHLGAQRAHGTLLLFTDADVVFAPEMIRLAVAYVERYGVDQLCVVPHLERGGYWESALVCCFALIFVAGLQPWLVPTRLRRAYLGVGAFNMVRREAYLEAGGHAAFPLDVIDDVKLGKLMKQAGFRLDILLGGPLLRVRWQPSAWGVVRGLEKNAFAAVNYSIYRLIALTAVFGTLFLLPYLAVVSLAGPAAYGWMATIGLLHASYTLAGTLFGAGWWVFPVLPITVLTMIFTFWRSAVVTLRQGGVHWRGTFYALSQLRARILR